MSGSNSSLITAANAAEVAAQQQHAAQQSAQAQHPISVSQLQQLQVYPSNQGAYQIQPLYQHTPQMFLPGNLAFQHPYQSGAGGISLQIPNVGSQKSQQMLPKSMPNHLLSQMKPGLSSTAGRTVSSGQMIKSATILPTNPQQYTQNNQSTVVISQLQPIMPQATSQAQQAMTNSKLLDAQKGKHFQMLQSGNPNLQQKSQMMPTSLSSQSIVNSQFKQQLAGANQAHLITAAAQSPMLNQAQLLGSLQQLPLTWAAGPAQSALMAPPNSQIFIRQPTPDGQQQLILQSSTQPLQTMNGTPVYVNPNSGAMHLMSAAASCPSSLAELHQPMITSSMANNTSLVTTTNTQTTSSAIQSSNNIGTSNHMTKNRNRPNCSMGVQNSNLENTKSNNQRVKMSSISNAVGLSSFPSSPASTRPSSVGSQQSRDTPVSYIPSTHHNKPHQKTTQQMNAELLLKAPNGNKLKNLIRSDSVKSLNSQGSDDGKFAKNMDLGKKDKESNKHLNGKKAERRELLTENIELNGIKSQNGSLKKSEKKKLGLNKSSNKPPVLTHVLEGRIILESDYPFAVSPYLSNTLRDRSNGISNQVNDLRAVPNQDDVTNKSNMIANSSAEISTCLAPKEVRIKNKKIKKSKLKAANQLALMARSNGHLDDKSSIQMQNSSTVVPIVNALVPYDPSVAQSIAIPKPNSLGPNITSLPPQMADTNLTVCNGNNLTHSAQMINGILVNDSVVDIDESRFMHGKQKMLASTPIKEGINVPIDSACSLNSTAIPEKPVQFWTVQDVYEYINSVSGADIAKVFIDNHIDGNALLLLDVSIMKDELKLKLGPVLVLMAKIDKLREKFADWNNEASYLPAERNIYKWSVADVFNFIYKLASKEYAENFEKQEIDGHALTLISREHLMKDMKIHFGPCLKILHKVKELKERADNS